MDSFNDPALELNLPKAMMGSNGIVLAEELAERAARRRGLSLKTWSDDDALVAVMGPRLLPELGIATSEELPLTAELVRRACVSWEGQHAKLTPLPDDTTDQTIEDLLAERDRHRAQTSAFRRLPA